ncbi:MAG: cytochrome P450 [Deltaproteobacteria bacterium]|nr:cytochrome P450 [Deltaproteobacteria bacterium]
MIARLSGTPIIGHLREFRRDRIALLERLAKECGEAGVLDFGGRRVLVTASPAHARIILQERAELFEKGPVVRRFARPLLGDGLVSVENAAHKRRRRLVAPAFAHRRIMDHTHAFVAETERMIGRLEDGAVIDLREEMLRLSLAVVGRTLFHQDLIGDSKALGDAMQAVMRHVSDRIARPLMLPRFVPTPSDRRLARAIAYLDATIAKMIDERRASGDVGDLLSNLVYAKDDEGEPSLDDREIRDETMTLFAAGHETVANALAWTLALLVAHPEELAIAATSIAHARQAIEEAMRLYPPVHGLGREAKARVELGDHVLDKGAIVLVSTYLMHRRSDLFPDALAFRPARFSPEARAALPPSAYLPFGAGPRACIGAGFALLQMPLVLTTLLERVSLEPVRSPPFVPRPEMLVTLRPEEPVLVRVRRRGARTVE